MINIHPSQGKEALLEGCGSRGHSTAGEGWVHYCWHAAPLLQWTQQSCVHWDSRARRVRVVEIVWPVCGGGVAETPAMYMYGLSMLVRVCMCWWWVCACVGGWVSVCVGTCMWVCVWVDNFLWCGVVNRFGLISSLLNCCIVWNCLLPEARMGGQQVIVVVWFVCIV